MIFFSRGVGGWNYFSETESNIEDAILYAIASSKTNEEQGDFNDAEENENGIENFSLDEIIFTDEEYEEANTDTMDPTSMPSFQMDVEDLEDLDSIPLYPGTNVTI